MKCIKRKWLFIFCSTYCFCSFNDCWKVYTVFPIHNFSTWRAKQWHSRYIYLIHCRRKKLVRITQFQAILEVGVGMFSAKLLLLFFLIFLIFILCIYLFFALFSETFAFIHTIYNFFLWYILFYHTCCPPFFGFLNIASAK